MIYCIRISRGGFSTARDLRWASETLAAGENLRISNNKTVKIYNNLITRFYTHLVCKIYFRGVTSSITNGNMGKDNRKRNRKQYYNYNY